MAQTDIRSNLSRIYRWLGMCVEFYENMDDEDEENKKMAAYLRDHPSEALDGLVQMRMSHITYMMRQMIGPEGDTHRVNRHDLSKMMESFAPIENNDWWPVWMEYLPQMSDAEWDKMWLAVDDTIKDMLLSDR